MKYGLFGGIALTMIPLSVLADEPYRQSEHAISIGSGGSIFFRKMLDESNQFFLSPHVGASQVSYPSGSSSIQSYSLAIGDRHYFTHEQLSRFGELSLGRTNSKGTNYSGWSMELIAEYGLEYFVSPSFSTELRAGVGIVYFKDTNTTPITGSVTTTGKAINFPLARIAATYHW